MRVQGPPRGLPRPGRGLRRRGGSPVPAERAVRGVHRHRGEAPHAALPGDVRDPRARRGARGLCVLRTGRGVLLMTGAALLVALTLVVAFANGANDVSKGLATLVGSGATDYRRAVLWGTVWTVAGVGRPAVRLHGLVPAQCRHAAVATPPLGPALPRALTARGLTC